MQRNTLLTLMTVLLLTSTLPLLLRWEAVLLFELPLGLPLGTLLAALAFVAGATLPTVIINLPKRVRWVGWLLILLAVLWLPLGIWLAGNPQLAFTGGEAADGFWIYTGLLAAVLIGALLWAVMAWALRSK